MLRCDAYQPSSHVIFTKDSKLQTVFIIYIDKSYMIFGKESIKIPETVCSTLMTYSF
jgi:tRNA(Leu) C34 or U34 (ribose-2'-O)-methylase TrmL